MLCHSFAVQVGKNTSNFTGKFARKCDPPGVMMFQLFSTNEFILKYLKILFQLKQKLKSITLTTDVNIYPFCFEERACMLKCVKRNY